MPGNRSASCARVAGATVSVMRDDRTKKFRTQVNVPTKRAGDSTVLARAAVIVVTPSTEEQWWRAVSSTVRLLPEAARPMLFKSLNMDVLRADVEQAKVFVCNAEQFGRYWAKGHDVGVAFVAMDEIAHHARALPKGRYYGHEPTPCVWRMVGLSASVSRLITHCDSTDSDGTNAFSRMHGGNMLKGLIFRDPHNSMLPLGEEAVATWRRVALAMACPAMQLRLSERVAEMGPRAVRLINMRVSAMTMGRALWESPYQTLKTPTVFERLVDLQRAKARLYPDVVYNIRSRTEDYYVGPLEYRDRLLKLGDLRCGDCGRRDVFRTCNGCGGILCRACPAHVDIGRYMGDPRPATPARRYGRFLCGPPHMDQLSMDDAAVRAASVEGRLKLFHAAAWAMKRVSDAGARRLLVVITGCDTTSHVDRYPRAAWWPWWSDTSFLTEWASLLKDAALTAGMPRPCFHTLHSSGFNSEQPAGGAMSVLLLEDRDSTKEQITGINLGAADAVIMLGRPSDEQQVVGRAIRMSSRTRDELLVVRLLHPCEADGAANLAPDLFPSGAAAAPPPLGDPGFPRALLAACESKEADDDEMWGGYSRLPRALRVEARSDAGRVAHFGNLNFDSSVVAVHGQAAAHPNAAELWFDEPKAGLAYAVPERARALRLSVSACGTGVEAEWLQADRARARLHKDVVANVLAVTVVTADGVEMCVEARVSED